jgi:nitrogen-specific signal transduction histidine kinase
MHRCAESAAHAEPGSIGLGLYIAREVSTAHGGSITAQSVDGLTTFSVSLPTMRAAGVGAAASVALHG